MPKNPQNTHKLPNNCLNSIKVFLKKVKQWWYITVLTFCWDYLGMDKIKFQYYGQVTKLAKKTLVVKGVEILSNGLLTFIGLYWLFAVFRIIHWGIYFGWYDIVCMVISLGCFSMLFRETYRFVKEDWKH